MMSPLRTKLEKGQRTADDCETTKKHNKMEDLYRKQRGNGDKNVEKRQADKPPLGPLIERTDGER